MKLEEITREIVEGRKLNAALSVDTSVFDSNGLRLGSGWLKHLEQFSALPETLLITNVVRAEVQKHLVLKMAAAQKDLTDAFAEVRDHWNVSAAGDAATEMLQIEDVKGAAEMRLDAFLHRCRAKVLNADGAVTVDQLMADYFAVRAPFEAAGAKKNEFPDAVALRTLEAWSIETGRYVLVVSTDKGWKAFADASTRLCYVDSLEVALGLFQRRDSLRAGLMRKLVGLLGAQPWHGLEVLRDHVADLRWDVEASSWHTYDVEVEVGVDEVAFSNDGDLAKSLHAVDYAEGKLTVAANLVATLDVDAEFSFDLEGVSLGSAAKSQVMKIEVTALLTFDGLLEDDLDLVAVDLPRRRITLDLGDVEPDYSDEQPDHEKY